MFWKNSNVKQTKKDLYGDNNVHEQSIESSQPTTSFRLTTESEFKVFDEIDYGLNINESILYFHGEVALGSLFDLISRIRIILKNRPEENVNDPITLLINTNGGDVYEANGIIDYIESLNVPVNIIARGRALSAGALLLCSGTGIRAASKSTVIMIHESSGELSGRSSDIKANADHIDSIEDNFYKRLTAKSNQTEEFWRKACRKDFYMSADEALNLGLIDKIV